MLLHFPGYLPLSILGPEPLFWESPASLKVTTKTTDHSHSYVQVSPLLLLKGSQQGNLT